MASLQKLVKTIVQRDVLQASAATAKSKWMVLVVDAEASRVLTPVLGMYDLMEERVSLVESLEKKRQPFPEMDVIYVCAASDKSVRAMAADWKGKSPYARAHAYFLSRLSDAQMSLLGTAGELTSRLSTLKELNMAFLAVEAQAFTLADPTAFRPASDRLTDKDAECARKIATVCVTLGEGAPSLRFRAGSERARRVATLVSDELTKAGTGAPARGAATVLVLDRADDPLTPLLHEYTYQALVQDMLDVEGDARDKVTYSKATKAGQSSETALLTENDALWVEMRHEHVAKVIDVLRKRVADFLASNAGAAKLSTGSGADLSLGDMAAALKRLPEFQAQTAALNKHMTIAHESLTRFHAANLLEVSQLEQTLATGYDDDGQAKRPTSLLADVCVACAAQKPASLHSVRLAAVYFVARGGRLAEAERSQLLNAVRPNSAQQEALVKLAKLVANAPNSRVPALFDAEDLARRLQQKKKSAPKGKKKTFASLRNALSTAASGFLSSNAKDDDDDDEVASSRYTPPTKAILEAAADDRLPEELYPCLLGAPPKAQQPKAAAQSVRNKANRFNAPSSSAAKANKAFVGPRLIVVCLGGVSYSELRVAYEVSDATNREVIIGATSLLSPSAFLATLNA